MTLFDVYIKEKYVITLKKTLVPETLVLLKSSKGVIVCPYPIYLTYTLMNSP